MQQLIADKTALSKLGCLTGSFRERVHGLEGRRAAGQVELREVGFEHPGGAVLAQDYLLVDFIC